MFMSLLPVRNAALLMVFFAIGSASALATGMRDIPDVASEGYWNTHDIVTARVLDVDLTENSVPRFQFEITQVLSSTRQYQNKSEWLSDIWLGDPLEGRTISRGESVVLFIDRSSKAPTYVANPESHPLGYSVVSLQQISAIRNNKNKPDALVAGAVAPDPIVALYCLGRLINDPPKVADKSFVESLQQLRNQDTLPGKVRICATDLTNVLLKHPLHSDSDYEWLQSAIASSKMTDFRELLPLEDRMLEYQDKRFETIEYLLHLVQDTTKRREVRAVACEALQNRRLFDCDNIDGSSEHIFEAFIVLLRDPSSWMRAEAAQTLSHLCSALASYSDSKTIERFSQNAKVEIDNAIATEKDGTCAFYMSQSLKQITETMSGIVPNGEAHTSDHEN